MSYVHRTLIFCITSLRIIHHNGTWKNRESQADGASSQRLAEWILTFFSFYIPNALQSNRYEWTDYELKVYTGPVVSNRKSVSDPEGIAFILGFIEFTKKKMAPALDGINLWNFTDGITNSHQEFQFLLFPEGPRRYHYLPESTLGQVNP